MPLPSAAPLARDTPPTRISTVEPISAVPVKVRVVALVMLSVSEAPESLPAARFGVEGAAGGVLSMVMGSEPAEATGPLPAASFARALIVWPAVSPLMLTATL